MNSKITLAACMVSLTILMLGAFADSVSAVLRCCYYEDDPDDLGLSPPYGYFTHEGDQGIPNDPDDVLDSRASVTWTYPTTTRDYRINAANVNGLTQNQAITEIRAAEDYWYNTVSSTTAPAPNFNYLGTTSSQPSLWKAECPGGGTSAPNSLSEIAFCDGIGPIVKWSHSHSSGNTVEISDADMVLQDDGFSYTANHLYNDALHEMGHMYGLGDLYRGYACSSNGWETGPPVMCAASSPSDPKEILYWGDIDGMRYLYPKLVSFSLSVSGTVTGSDSGYGVAGNTGSAKDLIFVYGDKSATGTTTLKAKGIWDIGSTGTGTVGNPVTLATVNSQVRDIGADFADIDGDANWDLVISYSRVGTGTPTIYYQVFFDISKSASATTFTWTGTAGPTLVSSTSNHEGTDVIITDINNNGAKDLVLVDSRDFPDQYYVYIRYGAISATGTVSSWSNGDTNGSIPLDDRDIGAAIVDGDVIAVNFKLGQHIRYHALDLTSSGGVDENLQGKHAPLYEFQPAVTLEGIGAAGGYDLGEESYNEMFFTWVDGTTGYYVIEWDSRINSHG